MNFLQRLWGFRWSLYIVRNGNEVVYAMHENSVIRIIGYVMRYFADGGVPVTPYSLQLNFNKKHISFTLQPDHFTRDGENITEALIEQIKSIDPDYRVKGAEPVFVDVRTKTNLKIRKSIDLSKLQAEIDNAAKPKVPTFFSIMDEVFGHIRHSRAITRENVSLIFNVYGSSMEQARAAAQVIQQTMDAEGIEGFAVPGVVAPDYLHAKGAMSYPVIMIEDNVIWQGSSPDSTMVRKWLLDNR